jgi:hypothetical protein
MDFTTALDHVALQMLLTVDSVRTLIEENVVIVPEAYIRLPAPSKPRPTRTPYRSTFP